MGYIYQNRGMESLSGEIWVDAIGFDGIYLVSSLGRIKSEPRYVKSGRGFRLQKGRILKQSKLRSGLRGRFVIENETFAISMNRLVYCSFKKDVSLDCISTPIMHVNNDPFDNRLENLTPGSRLKIAKNTFEHGKLNHIYKLRPKMLYRDNFGVWEKGNLVRLRCKKCFYWREIAEFRPFHLTCKKCQYKKNK